MKPKISVVMPTYNRGSIIKHPINGIMDQTFTDWEMIIVDDGSTDDTEAMVKNFTDYDPRIKYIKIPHSGKIGYVRNVGNKMAKGELLVVQDSDDVSLPDRLDVLWQEYKNSGADVLYHGMYMLYRDAELDIITRRFQPAFPYSQAELLKHQYIPGQVAYTKKAVMKVPYNDEMQVSDDWQILMELSLQGYKFHPITRGLYEYWHTMDSVTVTGLKNDKRKQDLALILKMLREKYKIDVIQAENFIRDGEGGYLKQEIVR